MRQSLKRLGVLLRTPGRHYFWGSAFLLLVALHVISGQVSDRYRFGSADLYQDVVDRWGAPISQTAPSLRYVESGTVFNTLRPLALGSRAVGFDAATNDRKRGLLYFSGFDFASRGRYAAINPEPVPIDLVFVFPLELERQSMVSDLEFFVDGEPTPLPLAEKADKLTWTGVCNQTDAWRSRSAFAGAATRFDTHSIRVSPLATSPSTSESRAVGTTTTRRGWCPQHKVTGDRCAPTGSRVDLTLDNQVLTRRRKRDENWCRLSPN